MTAADVRAALRDVRTCAERIAAIDSLLEDCDSVKAVGYCEVRTQRVEGDSQIAGIVARRESLRAERESLEKVVFVARAAIWTARLADPIRAATVRMVADSYWCSARAIEDAAAAAEVSERTAWSMLREMDDAIAAANCDFPEYVRNELSRCTRKW